MSKIIKVGMADLNICLPPDTITTLGLGSCVGIALRDPQSRVGGMVHVMLPDSTQIRNNTSLPKFADTGIEELVRLMANKGANRSRIIAKIAGGAQMFSFQNKSDMIRVGERNIEATKCKLREMKISLLAEDTGNNYGRTIIFNPETGDLTVKSVGKDIKVI